MNTNGKLNLNGVFGFNKLLVGNVDVETDVVDNTTDIKYIYDNVLTSLQNQITATVQNALNGSEVIKGFNSSLTGFQTSLSSLTTKEASDISGLQGQINTNYTTLDNKYSASVATLTTNQTGLQTQLTALTTAQTSNNAFSVNNSNTFNAVQTFSKGIVVDGGPTNIVQNLTIGSITIPRTLTIYSSPTFKTGLVVESGAVSFPSGSINASCIKDLPVGLSTDGQYTWRRQQTFNDGINPSSITMVGTLSQFGNTTLGNTSGNTLTVNASSTFNATASFRNGLTVSTTPVSFPDGSISASSISGLLSLSGLNSWLAKQTFTNGLSVSGGSASFLIDDITLGKTSTSQLTITATPTFNNGLTVSTGAITIPSNSLPITAISGLNTRITSLESSDATFASRTDLNALQLQVNTISLTPGPTGPAGPAGKDGTNGTNGTNGVQGPAGPAGPSGSSSLSTDVMTTRTSTQVGYQISTTTCLKTTTNASGVNTYTEFTGVVKLAELSGLTPVGSVWIVEAVVQQNSVQNLKDYFIEVQEGGTYTSNSGNINGVNIITMSHSYVNGQNTVKEKGTVDSASAVYVVSSLNTTNKLSLGGSFGVTTSISGILLKATRIA